MAEKRGRVTIPTDLDVIKETLDIMKEWGADAIRDCDGTEFPQELKDTGSKIYATYYTTRKDNDWAKAHPEEIQQMYIMTSIHTAVADSLEIHLMDHLYPDMLAVMPGMSDSASLDNVLEFFVMSGLSLPHAMAMLVPESFNDKNPIKIGRAHV